MAKIVGGIMAVMAATVLGLVLLVAVVIAPQAGACGTAASGDLAPVAGNQTENIRTIIGIAKTLGIAQQGWIVALATALQESGIHNEANPNQPESMLIPHDGVGSDHNSVGVFQQQPTTGWGTVAQDMSVALSAEAFFGAKPVGMTNNDGLLQIPGWESLPITEAAQRVQRSAFPDAYAKWQGEATQLAAANADAPALPLPLPAGYQSAAPASPGGPPAPAGGRCPPPVGGQPSEVAATPGTYYNPLRGIAGLTAERIDQGVDYAGAGPLYSLGDGVVLETTNAGWPGGAFIAIRLTDGPATGPVVFMAENIAPAVTVGQQVTANTIIGTLRPAYPNMEIGWGSPNPGTALAQAYGGDIEGQSTQLGLNFSELLVKLGAPAGILLNPTMGTLPSGWPTW